MDLARPYFSVVGDSISTFQAYSPVGAEHYAPDLASATGVASAEDTWWMQVIRTLGGAYLSNISISGNTICTEGKMGGFPPRRLRQLTAEGKTPDHILLYAGLNDVIFYFRRVVLECLPGGVPTAADQPEANLSQGSSPLRHPDPGRDPRHRQQSAGDHPAGRTVQRHHPPGGR